MQINFITDQYTRENEKFFQKLLMDGSYTKFNKIGEEIYRIKKIYDLTKTWVFMDESGWKSDSPEQNSVEISSVKFRQYLLKCFGPNSTSQTEGHGLHVSVSFIFTS
jgi:hypothetical protein